MEIILKPIKIEEIEQKHSHFFAKMVKIVIELNSLINIRPAQNNFSMDINNPELQKKVTSLIKKLIIF